MKSSRLFKASILAGLVLTGVSVCRADIVYHDTFTRVGNLAGSAPTVDNTGLAATWSGSSVFTNDGANCLVPSIENWSWPAIGLPIDMGYFWDTTLSCDVKLDNSATGDWVGIGYGPVGGFWNSELYMTLAGNGTVNAYVGPAWGPVMQLVTNAPAGIPGSWNTIAIQYSNYAATASIIVNGVYLAQDVAIPLSGSGGVNLLQYNNGGATIANFKVETPSGFEVPPSITTQPQGKEVFVGDPVTLSVLASGTAPLHYQWRTNSIDISGANLATYPIPAAMHSANYTVVVTNGAGAKTSDVARVVAHLKSDQTVAAADFESYVAGSYGFAYNYSSTNVPLPTYFTNPPSGGTDGSTAGAAVLDGTAWTDVQVDWAGLVGVFHCPASLGTPYLPAYQYSLDARVENLLPDKTNTQCGLTLTFKTPTSDALNASQTIIVSSNFQHYTFNLNTANFGGNAASDLAGFTTNYLRVNAVEFTLTAWNPAGDFVRGPGVSVVFDNLKLVQRASPPLTVTQNGAGQPVIQWPDPDTVLKSATNAAGPYVNVIGATSPYPVPPGQAAQFFRTAW